MTNAGTAMNTIMESIAEGSQHVQDPKLLNYIDLVLSGRPLDEPPPCPIQMEVTAQENNKAATKAFIEAALSLVCKSLYEYETSKDFDQFIIEFLRFSQCLRALETNRQKSQSRKPSRPN